MTRHLRVTAEQVGCDPFHGRVDLISGRAGEPFVLEVELIDPYLSLDAGPPAASLFAKALFRR